MPVFKVRIIDNTIVFRDDFKEEFRKFKEDNDGIECILEITRMSYSKENFEVYYKTEVVPRIRDLVNENTSKKVTLSINEIDFMLRNLFIVKRVMKTDNRNHFDYAKDFTDLSKVEQLNFLSSVNLWCWNTFKVTLPKIRI